MTMHPLTSGLRDYVTAADHTRYDGLANGFIRVDVTHSNLQARVHDATLSLAATIESVKQKLYKRNGTTVDHMQLFLRGADGNTIFLYDDKLTLRDFGAQNGDSIHIKDTDPYSVSAGGALENLDLVDKYVMDDETYDKRTNTLRHYIREQRKKNPNFKLKFGPQTTPDENQDAAVPERPPTPENAREIYAVGQRCEVNPGGRRGEVAYFGPVKGLPRGECSWVGVRLDEPQGKSDGVGPDGKEYFSCPNGPGYGCFVLCENVNVGAEFVPADPFAELSSEDEL
ncbi:microtubule-associated protein, putative [Perkinsus marinus ATCC 50983]|uniref:Microtubule-associated protein, putative n=1 Tax=Perkinsus marinus (strain ATCC 50983 / TXsc) TaxID=423536 RepID=C5L567_PERM5|nr:microtubule-associated protein, putative [Perkinsus marinus ATCC 50983]EER08126.1 microtubule-associated protein, putative [Perkinsus marinus ATCC 50983]|eukprot:XP_002776310.1 microtubule-associated protein, putative [Perkinsus marinus ATCC 50983]